MTGKILRCIPMEVKKMAKKKKKAKKAKKVMSREEMLLRKLFGDEFEEYRDRARKRIRANIQELERIISFPVQIATFHALEENQSAVDDILKNAEPEVQKVYKDAILEYHAIIYNTPGNKTGMHPQIFHGETLLYDIVREHETGEREYTIDLVETCATEEEANQKLAVLNSDEYRIVERDPDQYWAILDENNKEVWKVWFPTLRRAMAFLLYKAKTEATIQLLELHKKQKKEQPEKTEEA